MKRHKTKILEALQTGSHKVVEICQHTNLSKAIVWARLGELRACGVVSAYSMQSTRRTCGRPEKHYRIATP